MACNAVAVVKATIAEETLERIMASNVAHAAITSWLGNVVGRVKWHTAPNENGEQSWLIAVDGWDVGIAYNKRAGLNVSATYRATAEKVRGQLEDFLRRLRDVMLAAEVKQALKSRYAVTAEQHVGGATVLTVEV